MVSYSISLSFHFNSMSFSYNEMIVSATLLQIFEDRICTKFCFSVFANFPLLRVASHINLYAINESFNDDGHALLVFIIFSKGFQIIHVEQMTDYHIFNSKRAFIFAIERGD